MTILVLLLAGIPVPAAHAGPGALEYSEGGISWSTTPPRALFSDQVVLVPGASTSETLHLRNVAGSTGVLRLGLTEAEASSDAAAAAFGVSIVVTSRSAGSSVAERQVVAELHPEGDAMVEVRIAPREVVTLTVIVDLDAGIRGKVAQNSFLDIDLALRIAEATDTAEAPPTVTVPLLPSGDGGVGMGGGAGVGSGGGMESGVIEEGRGSAEGGGSAGAAAPSRVSEPMAGTDHGAPGILARTGIDRGVLVLTVALLGLGSLFTIAGRCCRRS